LLPFLAHQHPDQPVACRAGRSIALRQMLADMHALAERLPAAGFVLNGCQDRYRFTVGLGAALLRGQVSVLPHNHVPHTLAQLGAQFPGLYCLSDESIPVAPLALLRFPEQAAAPGDHAVPCFDAQQPAVVLFTSGSTGQALAHARSWGAVVAGARAQARRLGLHAGQGWSILGTVPSQHSYGFESSIQLALQSGSVIVADRPFFPADVLDTLAGLARPRLLVTTPVHLRALLAASRPEATADLVVSATAALPRALAREVERRFAAPLMEVYGCTETGQLATRRTVHADAWQPTDGVHVGVEDGRAYAYGDRLAGRIALSDRIELREAGHFVLRGRSDDMVNIAGKRSSLAFLERQLMAIPGVVDAACLVSEEREGAAARVSAFVVAPTLDRRRILARLRERVDAAFLPRPLVLVEALPRDGNGKLPRRRLQALALEHAGAASEVDGG